MSAGTVHVYDPVFGAFAATGAPVAKLPVLLPNLSCSMTVDAAVGVHVMVT